jgi:hypothetical protein
VSHSTYERKEQVKTEPQGDQKANSLCKHEWRNHHQLKEVRSSLSRRIDSGQSGQEMVKQEHLKEKKEDCNQEKKNKRTT